MDSAPLKSGMIAIAGRPNAGKSTLLNLLLDSPLAATSPKPQMTRERLHGILTEERGQIVFIDTPGIHRAKAGSINEFMVSEAKNSLEKGSADLIWYLLDPASALTHEEPVLDLVSQSKVPVFLILNKADRMDTPLTEERGNALQKQVEEELQKRGKGPTKVFRISALKKKGVGELLADAFHFLPQGPFLYPDPDALSDRPLRYFVAEKVRAQLYSQLGEELPYSCAVRIENFQESVQPVRIEASIYVERDSQKGMVVGKGGQKIKAIGQEARKEIEAFMGEKIFLGLQVKVLKDWTKNPKALKELGYSLPEMKGSKKKRGDRK